MNLYSDKVWNTAFGINTVQRKAINYTIQPDSAKASFRNTLAGYIYNQENARTSTEVTNE